MTKGVATHELLSKRNMWGRRVEKKFIKIIVRWIISSVGAIATEMEKVNRSFTFSRSLKGHLF